MKIISDLLLEEFKKKITFSPIDQMNNLAEEEIAFDYFDFYTSISSIYSSKIEGESLDADSYFKYKFLNVEFKPNLTRKVDDLFIAYQFAKTKTLNFENLLEAHELLSSNLLPSHQQGKIRTGLMYVFNEKSQIEYVAAPHQIVENELEKLISDIDLLLNTETSAVENFYYASMIHLIFVKIHPFFDGNGRSARLLEKWFLVQKFGENAVSIPLEINYYQNLQNYYYNIKRLGLEYDEFDYSKSLPFLLMTINSLKNSN